MTITKYPILQKEDYDKWAAYAQSKTANILFSVALAERLGSKGVFSFSTEVGGGKF
jgi:NAD(P)-dependent dehydrogenase (short-subunit alcohol dehydrogenase family)